MNDVNVKSKATTGYQTHIQIRQHQVVADEPLDLGGQDSAPTPMEYVSAALASCTSITLQMYANRKGWTWEAIEVEVNQVDNRFLRKITITGLVTEEQQKRILQIANACPVHKILTGTQNVETLFEHYGNSTNE